MAANEVYEPDLSTFRQRIRYIRCMILEINRLELSRRMGYPHASIANWENGARPQDQWEVAQAYAKVANTPGLNALWVLNGGASPLYADKMHRGQAIVKVA